MTKQSKPGKDKNSDIERYPYLVAKLPGQIAGYAYVGPFHDRPAYDWFVETSIYVDRNIRHIVDPERPF